MTESSTRADLAARAARAGGEVALERFRSPLCVETKANKNDLVTAADTAAQDAVVECIRSVHPDEPIVGEEDELEDPAGGAGTEEPNGIRSIPEEGPAWVIDPIDGTSNYVRGLRIWTTSVAATVDGEPVGVASLMPAMDESYTATRSESSRNGEAIEVSDREDPETFAVGVLGWGPTGDRRPYASLTCTVIDRFGDIRRLGSMQAALAFVASGQLDAAITTRRPSPWDSIAGAHLIGCAGGAVTDPEGRPWRHDSDALVASNGEAHEAVLAAARASHTSDASVE